MGYCRQKQTNKQRRKRLKHWVGGLWVTADKNRQRRKRLKHRVGGLWVSADKNKQTKKKKTETQGGWVDLLQTKTDKEEKD